VELATVGHKRQSEKTGQPPGALVYVGPARTEQNAITVIDYDADGIEEYQASDISGLTLRERKHANLWIHVDGLHQIEPINSIGDTFRIHPLVLEDILNTAHRPKIETFDEYLFVIMKFVDYDEKTDDLSAHQISIILGPHYVLSFQEGGEDPFDRLRHRMKATNSRTRLSGTDYLAYCIVDIVVDNYFIILDKLGERIDLLEEEVVKNPQPKTLKVIHRIKRDLIFLRRSVWPLREIVNRLINDDSALINDSTRPYLRDVFDHTIHAVDTLETFRDIVSGMLDIYLSSMSNKLNEIMKVLTIIATIFIPLTFLAGWYGMNFKNMPEIDSPWGYPLVTAAAIIIVVFMLVFFRRKKWI
jgi:magnesium transporter